MAQVLENPMKRIRIGKVVINIGVGKSGEPLEKAKRVIEELTGQKPSASYAKKTIRDFGIHKGEPIAAIVTLRGDNAIKVLKRLLAAKNNQIKRSSFDDNGNVSFGIREHIDIPGMKYNPDIGIVGMDVSIALERPGYRVSRRRYRKSKVGKKHRINKEDAIAFFKDRLKVEVI
ncbi:MAG: 50S ribosomal protein L5 [Candidatus Nitrosocaldaceae archaeon]|nr:MAG: 50S ribosomal protein L5 [Candidatus Nitrosocaldaceae archaeon]